MSEATTRQAGGQRLQRGQAEPLLDRREREDIRGAEQALQLVGLQRAQPAHVAGQVELFDARLEAVELVAIVEQGHAAGDQQQRVAVGERLAQAGEAPPAG